MHIPLSTAEIASALRCSTNQIETAVKSGALSRTISCPYRDCEDLNWCSIYDALENGLTIARFDVVMTRVDAALWIMLLPEADQMQDFTNKEINEKVDDLVKLSDQEGLSCAPGTRAKVARAVLTAQRMLVQACVSNDQLAA